MSASPGKGLLLRVSTTGGTFVTAGGPALQAGQARRQQGRRHLGRFGRPLAGAPARGGAARTLVLGERLRLAERCRLRGHQGGLRGRHAGDVPDRLSRRRLLPGQFRRHPARRERAARQGDLLRPDHRELRRAGLGHGGAVLTRSMLGTFDATIGGEPFTFDTRLGTIARIEERCGDKPIVEIGQHGGLRPPRARSDGPPGGGHRRDRP